LSAEHPVDILDVCEKRAWGRGGFSTVEKSGERQLQRRGKAILEIDGRKKGKPERRKRRPLKGFGSPATFSGEPPGWKTERMSLGETVSMVGRRKKRRGGRHRANKQQRDW